MRSRRPTAQLLFLAVASLTASVAERAAWAQVQYRKAIEVPAAGAEQVRVINRLGSVVVVGWNRPTVQVKAIKQAKNAELGERLRVQVFSRDGRTIRVSTYVRMKTPVLSPEVQRRLRELLRERAARLHDEGRSSPSTRAGGGAERSSDRLLQLLQRVVPPPTASTSLAAPLPHGRVDLELYLPRQMAVRARTFKHDLLVRGCRGGVDLSTEEGMVLVRDARGVVRTSAPRGAQRVIRVDGDVTVRGGHGAVVLRDIRGEVSATSLSGSIDARGLAARQVELRSIRGDIVLGGALERHGHYSLVTLRGGLTVVLPLRPSVRLTGRAATCRLGGLTGGQGCAGGLLDLQLGEGTTEIRLVSSHGEIRLQRAAH